MDINSKISSLKSEISLIRKSYGKDLLILGHHYQREEIIEFADVVGDSFYLARSASQKKEARNIIFCGVRFMAEAASILCDESQRVFHPDKEAGCPLADMADLDSVTKAWNEIGKYTNLRDIIPVTYINSSAELKAFCGIHEGTVCTSTNAADAMKWGFKRGKKLFFFPDQHLGRNTAIAMGIKEDEIVMYDPDKPFGAINDTAIRSAKIILWNGFCHVHTFFKVSDIVAVRHKYPGVQVVVHPECPLEVVKKSDASGSTSFIVEYARKAPKGSTIAIGTEINLVSRIAKENPDKKIIELKRSLCPNMFRITLEKLLFTIKNMDKIEPVSVPAEVKKYALLALQRMLEV
jgi:quinolinate synthase